MSSRKAPAKAGKKTGKVKLTVTGDPATEIFVLDGSLAMVARGLGKLTARLAPGLYKLKFKAGPVIQWEHVSLEPGSKPITIQAPALQFSSAAPLMNTSKTHEYHMEHAQTQSRVVRRKLGSGGELFVFARAWTVEADRARVTDRHPAAALTLHDMHGTKLLDLRRASACDLTGDPWAGCNVELTPGSYRLRVRNREFGSLEQCIVVVKHWQTQVFLLAEPEEGTQELRVDLTSGSILMAPRGKGFRTDDPSFRLTEIARIALSDGRNVLSPGDMRQMLRNKFGNPMLGILGALALAGSPDYDRELLRVVVRELERLVPGHPDVGALRIVLDGRKALVARVIRALGTPPMVRQSWVLVRDLVRASGKVPADSLTSRVAPNLWGSGAWLTWMADRLEAKALPSAPRKKTQEARDMVRIVGLGQQMEQQTRKTRKPLTDLEATLLNYVLRSAKYSVRPAMQSLLEIHGFGTKSRAASLRALRSAKPLSVLQPEHIALALKLPDAQVRRAVQSLAAKL